VKTVVRISIFSLAMGVNLGVLLGAPAQATSPTPKVGNCYNLTNKQVDGAHPPSSPAINCARLHNAETYRIAKWPMKTNPVDMVYEDALSIAEELCMPWKPELSEYFNHWAWYTPDRASWAKGARWVRCDAMISFSESEPFVFKKWLFKRLDIR
jgi:hypothetical protein